MQKNAKAQPQVGRCFFIGRYERISVNLPTVIKFKIIGSSENSAPVFVQYTIDTVICQSAFFANQPNKWRAEPYEKVCQIRIEIGAFTYSYLLNV